MRHLLCSMAAMLVLSSSAFASPYGILWAKGRRPVSFARRNAAGGVLYYGGPVISHAKVYAVFWGDNVDPETQAKIGPFFANMLDSTYMDWLSEYATNRTAVDGRQGTDQTIGRGTFEGSLTIEPANASAKLTDADIQNELDAQIAAGNLPAPSADSLYMVYFPAGIGITVANERACADLCAYHSAYQSPSKGSIFYGVMPTCGSGCDFTGSAFDSLSVVSSHECIEAVTDPFPTPGSHPAYPQAWNDAGGEEVGDLCTSGNSTVTGHGLSSAVQWEYDNSINGCNQGPWRQSASFGSVGFASGPRPVPFLDQLRAAPLSAFVGR